MSLIIIQIRVEKIMTSENLLTKIRNNKGTLLRTVIYTIGHFFIAAACVMYFTGASFDTAITDAIVEPLINGVWYFLLDKFWASKITNNKENLATY